MRAHPLILAASALAVSLATGSGAHGQVVTTAGGEVAGLAQKKIVDRMIVSDSVEIEMARLAVARTKNPDVHDLATLLVAGHRDHLDMLRKLAESPGVGRAADSSGVSDARTFDQLKNLPADGSFDRAFVTAQIQLHQQEIDNLKKWRASVTSPALQQDIDRTLPLLEGHLAGARAVSAKL